MKPEYLSDKEKELYNLIKTYEGRVTNKVVVEKLSEKHLGAIGQLIQNQIVEKTKTTKERDDSGKLIKYYKIKEKE